MESKLIHRQIKISSRIDELTTCLHVCHEMRDLLALESNTYFAFQTSFLEAVHNAIVHGNKLDEEKIVNIALCVDNEKIEVVIEDEGNGFDLAEISNPTCGDNIVKENGRGIFFIQNLCDTFEVIGKGNIVKLLIRI